MRYLVCLLVLCQLGCSVKSRPQESQAAATTPGLPAGSFATENGKFFIHPSSLDLVPNEENVLIYRIVTPDLEPADLGQYTFDVECDMPTMPQMGGPWKMEPSIDEKGRLKAACLIWHGSKVHLWQFTINILKDGEKVDRLVYSHFVREE